ncbi:MAG: COX15/CtaA family protein [Chloroflexota bacterium]|nr:COX15/CtaA family protein [Dehalococcoidia bacterium]MDW8252966.1 COX15/CtaA family protein [Chloroflexota bacterium]
MTPYRWLIVASALATYLLIVVGGIVRVTGSGLGCPDWPLCEGQVIPPARVDAWIEVSHRVTALAMSLISLAALVGAYWPRRRPAAPWLSAAAFLLILQILLGAIVVLTELPGLAVNLHLLFAMVILALILVGVVVSLPETWRPPSTEAGLRRLTLGTALAMFLLIVSGSYVFGSGTSLACSGWPFCESGILPSRLSDWVNYSHRLVAAVVGVAVFWTCWRVWRHRDRAPALGWTAAATVVLFLLQVAVGAFVVIERLNGPWPGLHLALAAAVWTTFVLMTAFVALPRTSGAPAPSAAPARLQPTT